MGDSGPDLAERLFNAVEAGDIDAVAELYAPDVEIWHNYDGAIQTAEENLRVLRWMTRTLSDVRYTDIRRSATAAGFVQQHVMRARTPNGGQVAIPACMVCRSENGRIVRLDEYLDSAHLAPLAVGGQPSHGSGDARNGARHADH